MMSDAAFRCPLLRSRPSSARRALEGSGKQDEAAAILETCTHRGADPTGVPAGRYKPLNEGTLTSLRKLWWCRPCETTWVA